MDKGVDERHPSLDWPIDDAIDMACRLAREDAIGGVHVAIDRRPTYAELLRYRRRAERCGLTLTVAASSLSLRPRHAVVWGDEPEPDALAWLSRLWRRVQDHLVGTGGCGDVDRSSGEAAPGTTAADRGEPLGPACHPPPATFLQRRRYDFRRTHDPALSTG